MFLFLYSSVKLNVKNIQIFKTIIKRVLRKALRIINGEDEDFKDKINYVNNKIKNYCNPAGTDFIDNSNSDRSCLNRGKLHLSRK